MKILTAIVFPHICFLGIFIALPKWKSSYYELIPVQFKASGIPCIQSKIETIPAWLIFNLGTRAELFLEDDFLRDLQPTRVGQEKYSTFEGEEIDSKSYRLSEVSLGSIQFKQCKAIEEIHPEKSFLTTETNHLEKSSRIVGEIGRGLLKNVNILMDFKHAQVIATNDLIRLKRESGYDLNAFFKCSYESHPKGILLRVDTDFGRVKLLLSTGANFTLIRKESFNKFNKDYLLSADGSRIKTSKFLIEGINFGTQDLRFLTDVPGFEEIDGLLGMDFLTKNIVYIDFKKNIIYLKRA